MKAGNVTTEAPPSAAFPAPASSKPETPRPVVATVADLPEFDPGAAASKPTSLDHVLDVSVCVTAELGRVTMSVGEILKLGLGSVVGLDRAISEPVDLLVQGVPFARGEVVVIEDRFAIRIQEILDPKHASKK